MLRSKYSLRPAPPVICPGIAIARRATAAGRPKYRPAQNWRFSSAASARFVVIGPEESTRSSAGETGLQQFRLRVFLTVVVADRW